MQIGELARRSGIPASTIRFYERKGLLQTQRRSEGGYRLYDESALEHLQFIRFAQNLGFSLDELPALFRQASAHSRGQDVDKEFILQRLHDKACDTREQIEQLLNQQAQIDTLTQTLKQIWAKGMCLDEEDIRQIISSKPATTT